MGPLDGGGTSFLDLIALAFGLICVILFPAMIGIAFCSEPVDAIIDKLRGWRILLGALGIGALTLLGISAQRFVYLLSSMIDGQFSWITGWGQCALVTFVMTVAFEVLRASFSAIALGPHDEAEKPFG